MATALLPPIDFGAPNRDELLPTITPHEVSLCFLVKGYLSPGPNDAGGAWPQRQALGDALLTAIRQTPTTFVPSLFKLSVQLQHDITQNLQGTPYSDGGEYGNTVVHCLEQYLENNTDSELLDRIVGLFDTLSHMVTTSTNARAEESVGADDNSVMGFFLRRCWCDFTALSFEEVCALTAACERYLDDFLEDKLRGDVRDPTEGPLRPRMATERHLAQALQRVDSSNVTARGVQLKGLEGQLAVLQAQTKGTLPAAHLLKAAVARARQNHLAYVTSMHSVFDTPLNPFAPGVGAVASGELPLYGRDRGRLQIGSLALAATHARLGHVQLALADLNEGLRAATVGRDDASLAHLLAVLCSIMETATPGSMQLEARRDATEGEPAATAAASHVEELMDLLLMTFRRSQEQGLPHLTAYSRLSLARHALLYPAKPPAGDLGAGTPAAAAATGLALPCFPAQSLAALETAAAGRFMAHLSMSCALCASVPAAPPSSSPLACLRILKNLPDMFAPTPAVFGSAAMGAQAAVSAETRRAAGSAPLLRSAGWSLHGGRRLAHAHCIAFLQGQGSLASAADAAVALSHLAVSVAESHGYAAAQRVLDAAAVRWGESRAVTLRAARLTIAHRRACHRGDVRRALELAELLAALAPAPSHDAAAPGTAAGSDKRSSNSTPAADETRIEYRLAAEEARALAYLYGGHYMEAEQTLRRRALPLAAAAHQPLAHIRLLLLLGRVYMEAEVWHVALAYVLAGAVQCRECHADMMAGEAVVMLARIHRRIGDGATTRATAELEAAMPLIIAHGGLELRGRALLEVAELMMERASSREKVTLQADRILELVHEARHAFVLLEAYRSVQHCYYLESLLHDAADDAEARSDAAEMFSRLEVERCDALTK